MGNFDIQITYIAYIILYYNYIYIIIITKMYYYDYVIT